MNSDISPILEQWPYEPSRTLRIIMAPDGRRVMQVRLPLGIEQYELEGRPDGISPEGYETFLAEFEDRLEKKLRQGDTGFTMSHEDFVRLQNESALFYYRYLMLFQINDFPRVKKDTEHNLRIAELVEQFSDNEEDRNALLQYRPYMIRMNYVSRAMLLIQNKEHSRARELLQQGIDKIKELSEIDSPAFQFEKIRSINYIKTALKQIKDKEDGPMEELRLELERAVQEENYERAAELRDRIQGME